MFNSAVQARSRMRPGLIAGLIAACMLVASSWAAAAWLQTGAGQTSVAAYAMPAGPQATAAVEGSSVTLSWSGVTLAGGQSVQGYELTRTDADTGATDPVEGDCAGLVTATTCTETSVPAGTWTYTVSAVQLSWTGAPGPDATAQVAASPTCTVNADGSCSTPPNAVS